MVKFHVRKILNLSNREVIHRLFLLQWSLHCPVGEQQLLMSATRFVLNLNLSFNNQVEFWILDDQEIEIRF